MLEDMVADDEIERRLIERNIFTIYATVMGHFREKIGSDIFGRL